MRKRALSLAVAMIAGVALVSASGAVTTKAQKVTKIDVSTRAAVVHYLRSIHVNPKGAVIQRGHRNYAGAQCPGKGWTCAATRHTVVQIAKRGGQNRFMCRSSHCVVVQFSGTAHGVYLAGRQAASAPSKPSNNTAFCVKTGSGATTGSGQSCTITQSGSGPNLAGVYENTQKVSGLTQSAQYTASITQQSSGSNGNKACVTQNINLDGSTTNMNGKKTTATLEAHQSVFIKQDSLSGNNSAQYAADSTGACITNQNLTQSQTLSSTVTATGPITQNENAGKIACPDGRSGVNTDYYNMCIDVEQNQTSGYKGFASGANSTVWDQNSSLTAIANTPAGPVNQTQSSNAQGLLGNGLIGTVNQDSTTGLSTATTNQTETQCEDAASPTSSNPSEYPLTTCHQSGDADAPTSYMVNQNQFGPAGVAKLKKHNQRRIPQRTGKGFGLATQSGSNTNDTFTINQKSIQDNDGGSGSNQHNQLEGDCITPGICTVNQQVIVNGNTTSNGDSGPDLPGVTINCEPGEEGSDCTTTPPPSTGPCSASSDTNAAYNDMPTDVVNCLNPGIGFEAQSVSEFGNAVNLSSSAGRNLASFKMDMQSFACQTGHWNGNPDDPSNTVEPCQFTDPTHPTFQWLVTANIYAVNSNGSPGGLLATSGPVPQTIPYRPAHDATGNCANSDSSQPDSGNRWWNPAALGGAGACQSSIATVLSFSNFTAPGGGAVAPLPGQVIWTVSFATTDNGTSVNPKQGVQTCSSGPDLRFPGLTDGGCPYDSLNPGDNGNNGGTNNPASHITNAPYAGSDVTTGVAYLNQGGTGLQSQTGWAGLRPLGEIITSP